MAEVLRDLVRRLPDHPAIVPLTDAGVADGYPFVTVASAGGQPLAAALRTYGPADIADALPRLRRIGEALDVAAAHGLWHGALTPQDIIISTEDTSIERIGVAQTVLEQGLRIPLTRPYAAPEVVAGLAGSTRADQFALAAIAHEWLFGRVIKGTADDGLEVPSLPDVDSQRLQRAFVKALASDPAERFESCTAFVDALEQGSRVPVKGSEVPRFWAAAALDDMRMYPTEAAAAPSAVPTSAARVTPRESRGGVVAALVAGGIALGLLGIWLTRRSSDEAQTANINTGQPFTDAQLTPPAPQPAPLVEPPVVPAVEEARPVVPTRRNIDAAPAVAPSGAMAGRPAAQVDAGLLIHSTPAGAVVSIDGVERGVTPVAVRGLPLGTRTVIVTRSGYRPSERQITLTSDRPSRTLEVGLVPAAVAAQSRPAARETGLIVDSRPAGAGVSIDGRPVGVTPTTIALAPGTYRVRIERAGYRTVTTTVDVSSGQRARVAVRLEGGQEEE